MDCRPTGVTGVVRPAVRIGPSAVECRRIATHRLHRNGRLGFCVDERHDHFCAVADSSRGGMNAGIQISDLKD